MLAPVNSATSLFQIDAGSQVMSRDNHSNSLTEPERHDSYAMPSGPVREALRLSVRQLEVAELQQQPAQMCQALAQVGRCYGALQAWAPAESYLLQALRWSHTLGAQDMGVELLCDLAEVTCSAADSAQPDDRRGVHAARERARDHAFEAAALAALATDPHWEVKVLLRVSDVLDRCGDHDDAISLQTRALALICSDTTGHAALDSADTIRVEVPTALM
jgi:tetratricopeptide (TPR) repeat protein